MTTGNPCEHLDHYFTGEAPVFRAVCRDCGAYRVWREEVDGKVTMESDWSALPPRANVTNIGGAGGKSVLGGDGEGGGSD